MKINEYRKIKKCIVSIIEEGVRNGKVKGLDLEEVRRRRVLGKLESTRQERIKNKNI